MKTAAKELLSIAKVTKSFGTEGAVIIRYAPSFQEELKLEEPLFIKFDNMAVPFFITSLESRGVSRAVLKLKGVETLKYGEELVGRRIYIEQQERSREKESDLTTLIGYTVVDREGGRVGVIAQFYNYPGNPCFEVERGEERGVFLLPIHPHLIVKVEPHLSTIVVELPKGLEELK